MLNLKQLMEAQRKGESLLSGLSEDEKVILQHYAYLAAESLIKLGAQQQAAINEVVMNAYRNGIGMGLQLTISEGKVGARH